MTFARTLIDTDEIITKITAESSFPQITEWLENVIRSPASDAEALSAFGPRDGRVSEKGSGTEGNLSRGFDVSTYELLRSGNVSAKESPSSRARAYTR